MVGVSSQVRRRMEAERLRRLEVGGAEAEASPSGRTLVALRHSNTNRHSPRRPSGRTLVALRHSNTNRHSPRRPSGRTLVALRQVLSQDHVPDEKYLKGSPGVKMHAREMRKVPTHFGVIVADD